MSYLDWRAAVCPDSPGPQDPPHHHLFLLTLPLSKASLRARRAFLCMFLNASLFLFICQFFSLQPFILPLTHSPKHCHSYGTAVWKQAPTHILSSFTQSAWHPAYHSPEGFILSIFLLSAVCCQLPATSHVVSALGDKVNPPLVGLLPLWSPTNLNRTHSRGPRRLSYRLFTFL